MVLALAGGILLGREDLLLSLIVISLAAILGRITSRGKGYWFLLFLSFLSGWYLSWSFHHPVLPPHHISHLKDSQRYTLRGEVVRSPYPKGKKLYLILDVKRIVTQQGLLPASGRLRVTVPAEDLPLRRGDSVEVTIKVRRPRNFLNPGAFDYRGYLLRRGIWMTGYLKDLQRIRIIQRSSSPLGWLDGIRERMKGFLRREVPSPGREVLLALLLGEKGSLSKEVREAFIRAGVAHVLAISGLHLGIIAALVFFGVKAAIKRSVKLLLRLDGDRVAAIGSIPPLFLYIFLSGAPLSVVRAGIMVGAFLLSLLIKRYRDPLNLLSLAAIGILLLSPGSLWEVSFQLSFGAVAGILLLTPAVSQFGGRTDLGLPLLEREKRVRRWIRASILVSLAATLTTAPILAFHFHRLSLLSPLSNLVVIPLVGLLILPLGLLGLSLIPLSPMIASPLLKLSGLFAILCTDAVMKLAALPLSSIYLPSPTHPEIALYFAILSFPLWRRIPHRRVLLSLILLLLAADVLYWSQKVQGDGRLEVVFLDVGQGDAAFVRFPGGEKMLIDAGGLFGGLDTGEKIIAPFLWRRRFVRVDYLVLSHPQPDHYKGLLFIARHFRPLEFWYNGRIPPYDDYRELLRVLKKEGVKMIRVGRGFVRTISGVKVEVLHPPYVWRGNLNNSSLVVRIGWKGWGILFTGDIEGEAEEYLVRAGDDFEASLLKVPHHGSKRSSTLDFLRKVSPSFAVISVGAHNPFHLPHPDVLKRYRRLGIEVLRTDLDGAITFLSDGKGAALYTFSGPRRYLLPLRSR